jgi:glyoxylase-like metal-dependent hydrolase (beta-lactamase superfamily II)
MTTYLCKACGTQYPPSDGPPEACPICEDPRQYIPHDDGQQWVEWREFLAAHKAEIRDDHGILGIGATPSFAIDQRALLVKSNAGNVLWDCTPYLDDEIVARVGAEGGIAAIAISHPHFYSSMIEWSRVFDAPIYLHTENRPWVMRPDQAIRFWEGDAQELLPGLTVLRCGGHFPGSSVLHWADGAGGKGALFTADTINVVADRRYVSFMYSYPNQVPLNASAVRGIVAAVEPYAFDRIYGSWPGSIVAQDAKAVVRRSAERYIAHIEG